MWGTNSWLTGKATHKPFGSPSCPSDCISQTHEKAQRTGNRILTPDLSTQWHQGTQACWVSKDRPHHYKLVVALWSLSHLRLSVNPWTAACQASLSTISLELAQTHIHWVADAIHLIFYHLLLLLPSIFPSIRVFSNELALHIRWPKYWSFSRSPSNEYSGLISFRIDWLDLLVVQGTLKSPLQCHSQKH